MEYPKSTWISFSEWDRQIRIRLKKYEKHIQSKFLDNFDLQRFFRIQSLIMIAGMFQIGKCLDTWNSDFKRLFLDCANVDTFF